MITYTRHAQLLDETQTEITLALVSRMLWDEGTYGTKQLINVGINKNIPACNNHSLAHRLYHAATCRSQS